MFKPVNTRWQAFGIHLCVSLCIFLVVASIVLLVWYPAEFRALGGFFGLKIIGGVDVVLGPLLTLIVYNKAKKSLKWDLSVIFAIQLTALCYGVWAIHSGRPIAQVLYHEGIYIVTEADLVYFKVSRKEFVKNEKLPMRVYMDLPPNLKKIHEIAFATEFMDKKVFALRKDLYKTFDGNTNEILQFYINKGKRIEAENCVEFPVISVQEETKGCINIQNGRLKIR